MPATLPDRWDSRPPWPQNRWEFEMHYRADRQILVLSFLDNQDTALPILQGQVFETIGPSADDRFIVVKVKGQQFLVFASDVKLCATAVPYGQRSVVANPKVAA
jgi:hypothetical protein